MRKKIILLALSITPWLTFANDTVFVKETQIPILIERQDNVIFYLRIDAVNSKTLESIGMQFDDIDIIKSVKLYYGGTEGVQNEKQKRFFPVQYIARDIPNKTLKANKSYSLLLDEVKPDQKNINLIAKQNLFAGVNYFWISVELNEKSKISETLKSKISNVHIDGKNACLGMISMPNIEHRLGVGVRHAGDNGSAAFRIPGLVTTNKGTLLGVYDVRYNNSKDLQEHIDIGLSRSTNGGQTWEKMQIPLSFGTNGGLPSAQNGVGDPAILVDTKTNNVWIIAAWTHGMGNLTAWHNSQQGMDKNRTAQLILTKSTDDGKTWSKPINITNQVKKPNWYFLLQGPGRGIATKDGTLVFPIQFIDSDKIPNAGIMYSKDGGNTWKINNSAQKNTTEAQVAELPDGSLILNMRDNRGGSRSVFTTNNFGETWNEHASSRKALIEPICMASLINVDAKGNIFGKNILLFSNPNTTKGRNNITIKASLDNGITWLPENQILLDEDYGWGYSCLSMVNPETIGILYESSVAHMTFQTVKIKDLIKKAY